MSADPSDIFGDVASLTSQTNALCAARADALLAAGRAQVDRLISRGVTDSDELERVVKDRAGRALQVSPTRAGSREGAARDLHGGLDHVRGPFSAGLLDEYTVVAITDATRQLTAVERAEVDRRLAGRKLETLSVGRICSLTEKVAVEIAPGSCSRPRPCSTPTPRCRRSCPASGRCRSIRWPRGRVGPRCGGHRFRRSHGGPTSFDNDRGRCVVHNHVRDIGITRKRRPRVRSRE